MKHDEDNNLTKTLRLGGRVAEPKEEKPVGSLLELAKSWARS
jgi:hypothetical protein